MVENTQAMQNFLERNMKVKEVFLFTVHIYNFICEWILDYYVKLIKCTTNSKMLLIKKFHDKAKEKNHEEENATGYAWKVRDTSNVFKKNKIVWSTIAE